MKKGEVRITMLEHVPGRLCGTCHDGRAAFSLKDNCDRCHELKLEPLP